MKKINLKGNSMNMMSRWCGTYSLNDDKTYSPCSVEEWGKQSQEMRRKKTKHVSDEFIGKQRISTVWLGLDYNYFGGEPLVLETMVFDKNGNDIYCERYSTWQQAEEGHKKARDWVLDGCKND